MSFQIRFTRNEAKHIAHLPKYRGQEYLAKKLHLGSLDEEDLKSGLIVDYFYDVLQYSTNRGFPWKEVAQSIHFALEIIQQCQGLEFIEAVRLLQRSASSYIHQYKLSLQSAKLLCQYFTTSFMAHYKLYQYVLSWPQELNQGNVDLTVECPPEIMKLSTAETLQAWEYAAKMKVIAQDEAQRKEKLDGMRQESQEKTDNADYEMKMKYLEGDLQSIALNDAEKLIAELASDRLTLVKQDVAHSITELTDTADIALARQSVKVPPGYVNPRSISPPKGASKPKSSVSRKSSSSNTSKKRK